MNQNKPLIIQFEQIGEAETGFISVAEFARTLPFECKRIYWVHGTPVDLQRGNHANKTNRNVLVCVQGNVKVEVEDSKGNLHIFELCNPNEGLMIPPLCWKKITFNEPSVLLSLCSEKYNPDDYVRDYQEFTSLKQLKRSKYHV